MDQAKQALIAEIQEVTGKGRGEQKVEIALQKMTREAGQLGGGKVQLGNPGWEYMPCPSCNTSLKYYVPPYYPYPPYGPLSCPECGADLGVMGMMVVKSVQVTPIPEPEPPTEPPTEPTPVVAGFGEWIKSYWPHLTVGGLAVVLAGVAIVKYRKR